MRNFIVMLECFNIAIAIYLCKNTLADILEVFVKSGCTTFPLTFVYAVVDHFIKYVN